MNNSRKHLSGIEKGLLYYIITPVLFSILILLLLRFAAAPILNRYSFITGLFSSEVSEIEAEVSDEKPEEQITVSDKTDGSLSFSEAVFPTVNKQMGSITIESTEISCPLYFGDSDANLDRGAELYDGSNIPGMGGVSLVAGHCASFFSTLGSAPVGGSVTLETENGVYTYVIRETAVKKASDKSAVDLSKKDNSLIIYTCYPFNTIFAVQDRYFVYCDYVSGPLINLAA